MKSLGYHPITAARLSWDLVRRRCQGSLGALCHCVLELLAVHVICFSHFLRSLISLMDINGIIWNHYYCHSEPFTSIWPGHARAHGFPSRVPRNSSFIFIIHHKRSHKSNEYLQLMGQPSSDSPACWWNVSRVRKNSLHGNGRHHLDLLAMLHMFSIICFHCHSCLHMFAPFYSSEDRHGSLLDANGLIGGVAGADIVWYWVSHGMPWPRDRSFLLIFIEFPGRLLLFHTMREGAAGVSGTVALLEVDAKIFLEVSPEWTPGYLREATRITLGSNLKCLTMPHSSHFARSLWEQDDASLWAHTLT